MLVQKVLLVNLLVCRKHSRNVLIESRSSSICEIDFGKFLLQPIISMRLGFPNHFLM